MTLLTLPLKVDFKGIHLSIELRSRTDSLATLQAKMQEYIQSGVRLGWLINPQDQQVEIYRPGQETELKTLPTEPSGETVLPGFVLAIEHFCG